MKIQFKDLVNIAHEKVYNIDIKSYVVKDNIYLRRIEDVSGDISFYYDLSDELRINYELEGKMICPDAYTMEDCSVDFHLTDDLKIVKDLNEEGFYFNDGLSIEEMVLFIIMPEVPIKVGKNEKIGYTSGDGWSFVSEEDYKSSRADEIDPRLQKLKEYKFEED